MINKWIEKLNLTDWSIQLESIEKEQVICDCPPEDCYFIGVDYNTDNKSAIIYYDRPLTEEDIVHELLHIKHNDWTEDQINMETNNLLK